MVCGFCAAISGSASGALTPETEPGALLKNIVTNHCVVRHWQAKDDILFVETYLPFTYRKD
jgi:hypothetical protein